MAAKSVMLPTQADNLRCERSKRCTQKFIQWNELIHDDKFKNYIGYTLIRSWSVVFTNNTLQPKQMLGAAIFESVSTHEHTLEFGTKKNKNVEAQTTTRESMTKRAIVFCHLPNRTSKQNIWRHSSLLHKGRHLGKTSSTIPKIVHLLVLNTWSSSTIPSLPPPNTIIKSLIATARWPWRGLGQGPVEFVTRFHFSMGAAILLATMSHQLPGCPNNFSWITWLA